MAKADEDRELISGTIRDIEESIEKLLEDMRTLQQDLNEKRARLHRWKTRMSELARASGSSSGKMRRKKGENLRVIVTLLEAQPRANPGLSIARISEVTGLPWSSVRAALQRQTSVFMERDGVWYLRPERPTNIAAERDAIDEAIAGAIGDDAFGESLGDKDTTH